MTVASGGKNRTIWIVAAVAVVSLIAGIVLSNLVKSPAERAAEIAPPEAGLVTVPVESRTLSNDVTIRADVAYEDPTSLSIATGESGIVTGSVPAVGDTLDAGDVALEVFGRPVILLQGEIAAFRSFESGVSGPDVLQLKQALAAIGLDPGNLESNTYDQATANAVAALYKRVGYPAPTAGDPSMIKDLEDAVQSARDEVNRASQALTDAKNGKVPTAELASLNAQINIARGSVVFAEESRPACLKNPDLVRIGPNTGVDYCEFNDLSEREFNRDVMGPLRDSLTTAEAAKTDAINFASDTTEAQRALNEANRMLTSAQENLNSARAEQMTPLPLTEVVFAPALPRRVDSVHVTHAGYVEGPILSLSGATLRMSASASPADAKLLVEGATALAELPDGSTIEVTIETLDNSDGESTRTKVTFAFPELSPEQLEQLQWANLKVVIPVGSTSGDVMAVPMAALTQGPGGATRVEVERSPGNVELIEVKTGLSAAGFVEVTPVDGDLKVGDLVVIGIDKAPTASAGEDEKDSEPSEEETAEADE